MMLGSSEECSQPWSPQDSLGGSSHILPRSWWWILIHRSTWNSYRQRQLSWPSNRQRAGNECWGLCQIGRMFPWSNFSHPKYSLPMHGILFFQKYLHITSAPLVLLRREAKHTSYPHSEEEAVDTLVCLKWHKLVTDLGSDCCGKVWMASPLMWQDLCWISSLLLPS